MRYVSTRGEAPALGFRQVVRDGLASDGGLYVPEHWPQLTAHEIAGLAGCTYAEAACRIVSRFADGEIDEASLLRMTKAAYATFRHEAVAPLRQIGANHFLLELFHGPTLAFKDLAMQLLARMVEHILAESGERLTVVGATSGDTGGAAIEAFRGRERVDVAILFPDGRVSPVQRRQMTTTSEDNVQAIAIEGTFDDAQVLVKAMFADATFRERTQLSGVNSINWGRIAAQIVYYFTAAVALGAPHRAVSFTVPSGNFGNVFAGYAAKRMGLPIERLIVATNVNDILHRALTTGRYEVQGVTQTISPSMDIQVSSNFERLLFEAEGRDGAIIRQHMAGLRQSGAFTMSDGARKKIAADFSSGVTDEAATAATIAQVRKGSGELIDPHTAVAVGVAEEHLGSVPMITLAAAHPAKFPEAVEAAAGERPELPDWAQAILSKEETYQVLPAELETVEEAIASRSRATKVAG